jgi:pimeloyl-ACP methyl ester carboxylesterase
MDAEAAAKRLARFKDQVKQLKDMTEAELMGLGRRQSPTWEAQEFPAWIASKQQVSRNALPILPTPWQDDIRRIRAPTLLIYGDAEQGSLVGVAAAREARDLNKDLRALRIEGAGHNVRRENFPAYLLAVRSFLNEI